MPRKKKTVEPVTTEITETIKDCTDHWELYNLF